MAKAFSGKKPQHFGNTIRVFLNYLGRHKFMLGLVGVLTAVSALANLLGTYMIKPVVNGPLMVTGKLEVESGTGRNVDRVEKTWLCRCGHSSKKPFCDGTHKAVGFEAP